MAWLPLHVCTMYMCTHTHTNPAHVAPILFRKYSKLEFNRQTRNAQHWITILIHILVHSHESAKTHVISHDTSFAHAHRFDYHFASPPTNNTISRWAGAKYPHLAIHIYLCCTLCGWGQHTWVIFHHINHPAPVCYMNVGVTRGSTHDNRTHNSATRPKLYWMT